MVASEIPGRSVLQCLHRWQKLSRKEHSTGVWTDEEDKAVIAWVEKHGPTKWSLAGPEINMRSGKQIRERWLNVLQPGLTKRQWTAEEDRIIFEEHDTHGPAWTYIATKLPGRNENTVKNRFHSSLRKIFRIEKNIKSFLDTIEACIMDEQSITKLKPPVSMRDYKTLKNLQGIKQFTQATESAEKILDLLKQCDEVKSWQSVFN